MSDDEKGIVVQVDGFALYREPSDGEFRIRDIDLAERLAYERPRKIRELIASMIGSGEIVDVQTRPVLGRVARKGRGEVTISSTEYWLDRIEALLVVMRSDAANAVPMRRVIADVFYKALLQHEQSKSALRRLPQHIERWFLSPMALDFQQLWPRSFANSSGFTGASGPAAGTLIT